MDVKDIFRIGIVHTINEEKKTARVKYPLYAGIISAELKVVWQKELWMPDINDTVICICPPEGDGDGYIIGRV